MLKLIFALIAVAVAVPAGGLLAGVDRRLTARLQSRQGAIWSRRCSSPSTTS